MATYPSFQDLPFNSRPDLSPYVIHLTKNTQTEDEFSTYDNLVNILKQGEIWGSNKKKGFIRGPKNATCFMDVPFQALTYVLTPEDTDPENPRYEPTESSLGMSCPIFCTSWIVSVAQ